MGNSDKSGAADGVTVDLDEPQGCYQGVGKGVDSRDAGGLQVDRSTAVAPLRVLFVDDETPIREVMRIESMKITPNAILSRNLAAVIDSTLVICLPGKPKGAVECLGFVEPAIPHCIKVLQEVPTSC